MPIDIISVIYYINCFIAGLFLKNRHGLIFFLVVLWIIYESVIKNISFTKDLLVQYLPIPRDYWENRSIGITCCDIVIMLVAYSLGNQIPMEKEYLIDLDNLYSKVTEGKILNDIKI